MTRLLFPIFLCGAGKGSGNIVSTEWPRKLRTINNNDDVVVMKSLVVFLLYQRCVNR